MPKKVNKNKKQNWNAKGKNNLRIQNKIGTQKQKMKINLHYPRRFNSYCTILGG